MSEASRGTEIKDVPLSPQLEITSFLHRVWSHSLLDEKTINHRRQFPERYVAWCRSWGLDENSLVAVLCGSSLWITDRPRYSESSDWDFILYGPKEIIRPYREFRRREFLWNEHFLEMYDDWDIHPEKIRADSELNSVAVLAPLLLTPDNFIAGNLDLAHIYRRALLELKNPDVEELKKEFYVFMRGWSEYKGTASKMDKRRGQFRDALNRKAREIDQRKPYLDGKFIQLFLQKLAKIEPPPLGVFKQAVEATGGIFVLPRQLGKNITRL